MNSSILSLTETISSLQHRLQSHVTKQSHPIPSSATTISVTTAICVFITITCHLAIPSSATTISVNYHSYLSLHYNHMLPSNPIKCNNHQCYHSYLCLHYNHMLPSNPIKCNNNLLHLWWLYLNLALHWSSDRKFNAVVYGIAEYPGNTTKQTWTLADLTTLIATLKEKEVIIESNSIKDLPRLEL